MATLPPGVLSIVTSEIIPLPEETSTAGAVINFDPPLFIDVEFSLSVERVTAAGLTPEQAALLPTLVAVFSNGDEVVLDNTSTTLLAPTGASWVKLLSKHVVQSSIDSLLRTDKIYGADFKTSVSPELPTAENGGPFSTVDIVRISLEEGNIALPAFGDRTYRISVARSLYGKAFLTSIPIFEDADVNSIIGENRIFGSYIVFQNPLKIRSPKSSRVEDKPVDEMEIAFLDIGGSPVSEGLSQMRLSNLQLPTSSTALAMWSAQPSGPLIGSVTVGYNGIYPESEAFETEGFAPFILNMGDPLYYAGVPYNEASFQANLQAAFDQSGSTIEDFRIVDIYRIRLQRRPSASFYPGAHKGGEMVMEYLAYKVLRYLPI